MLTLEEFGSHTRSSMEMALSVACAMSPSTFATYPSRKVVADQIRQFASTESRSLEAMIRVGQKAAAELIARESEQVAS